MFVFLLTHQKFVLSLDFFNKSKPCCSGGIVRQLRYRLSGYSPHTIKAESNALLCEKVVQELDERAEKQRRPVDVPQKKIEAS